MVFGVVPKIQTFVVNRVNWSPKVKTWLMSDGGPFTVFFWCPWFKWAIVFANVNDFKRPPQNVSAGQQAAVSLTGFVWARYATQIYPIGLNLFFVNLFMGASGLYQLFRK